MPICLLAALVNLELNWKKDSLLPTVSVSVGLTCLTTAQAALEKSILLGGHVAVSLPPQDATWEDKCVDTVYNYSWCTPKTYPCPITCGMDEQAGFGFCKVLDLKLFLPCLTYKL